MGNVMKKDQTYFLEKTLAIDLIFINFSSDCKTFSLVFVLR